MFSFLIALEKANISKEPKDFPERKRRQNSLSEKINRKLKAQRNKIPLAFTFLLILTIASLDSIVITNAAVTEWNTYLYVSFAPNPVGVGQTVVVSVQLDKVNPLASGVYGGQHFGGFMVKITKPDGTTENKGPYEAWATSGVVFFYTPAMVGNYSFKATFPGQWVNTTGANAYQRWYKPSTSESMMLNVQQDKIPTMQNNPLPTGYWTRPVYGENKGWNTIADNWLMPAYNSTTQPWRANPAFAPYTSAPKSPHVLWKQPVAFGGIVGGPFGDRVYYTGISYEQHYLPMVINGRIIYNVHGPSSLADIYGTRCLDLYTGEEIWFMNNTNIAYAQTLDIETPNEHGVIPYLWETTGTGTNGTWRMYDAFNGRYILTVTNITSGTTVFGPNGELLSYSFSGNATSRRLILWNSTLAISGAVRFDTWSPRVGTVIDGARGIQWNVSLPAVGGTQAIRMIGGGYILAEYTVTNVYPPVYAQMAYPDALQRDSSGLYPTSIQHLWAINRTDIFNAITKSSGISNGVYAYFSGETLQFHGYNIKTGEELWITEPLETGGWGYFTYNFVMAYGNLFAASYDGHARAYDGKTGELLWDYYAGSAGYETPYGTWPFYNNIVIADGKLFSCNDEHSSDSIMWRGGKLRAINTDSGIEEWSITGWMRPSAISDGILTSIDHMDMQIYTFGKGPSQTTVEAPLVAVPLGTGVTIAGTVADLSPGQKGTPAISDDDMAAWMEYMHTQKPIPANATGVPVSLTAIDSNGKTVTIGTVVSDIGGSYGISWTPTAVGKYRITATFEGTNSYGNSYATTYMTVGPASASPAPTAAPTTPAVTFTPTATPTPIPSPSPPTPPSEAPNTMIFVTAAAVVIIVGVAVTAAALLRRRK